MGARSAQVPLTPAQAIARGRKLAAARRDAEEARKAAQVPPEAIAPSAAPAQPTAATESEKPADLSTRPQPKPALDARRKAAFNGGQVRPVRPVSLAGQSAAVGLPRSDLWDTPDLVERLRELWTSSGRSAHDIAVELSRIAQRPVTRRAVLGKAHRMGLIRSEPAPATGPARSEEAAQRDNRGAHNAAASLRAIRAGAAKRAPQVRLGGGENDIARPISERNQRLEAGEAQLAQKGKLTRNACLAGAPSAAPRVIPEPATLIPAPTIEAAKINAPFGAFRIADLRTGQCRFACTDDRARPEDHRFCGRPTRVGRGNLHGSWCEEHLARVWGRGSEGERNAERVLRRYG